MDAILPGLKSALNYHPIFVHFPIALWLAALLFELLAVWRKSDEMHNTGVYLLYVGTLAGIVTVLTGLYAEESVPPGPAMDAMGFHEEVMLISFAVAVALCLFAYLTRKKSSAGPRKMLLLGMVVLAILMTVGADRGAEMVYRYGVSVNWPRAAQQK